MFSKSGVISGGSTALRTKARCWEEKGVAQLKERKYTLMTELRVSHHTHRLSAGRGNVLNCFNHAV